MSELPRSASVAELCLRARFEAAESPALPMRPRLHTAQTPTPAARLSALALRVAHDAAHVLVAPPSLRSRCEHDVR